MFGHFSTLKIKGLRPCKSLWRISCMRSYILATITAQRVKSSSKDFFIKFDQIRSFLQIWSHLQKKSLREILTFCAVCAKIKLFLTFRQNLWKTSLLELRNLWSNVCWLQIFLKNFSISQEKILRNL